MSPGRSSVSPRPVDGDVDMENGNIEKRDAKVVIVTNLTRNVLESHLQAIFSFYGEISKIDLPLFVKSGQNRGKAALEFADSASAQKAASHMDGGQIDGTVVKVELSELPIRARSRSPRPRPVRNGRDKPRTPSRSRSRSRSPTFHWRRRPEPRLGSSYRGRAFGRRVSPGRNSYRPRSRTRSRSPIRRGPEERRLRRRSPSYERGGTGYGRGRRSRSRSSVRSRRSRMSSFSRSRSRSPSYSSLSRYSRSKSRSRSFSRGRRSYSRDDIRDSRSRSPNGGT